METAQSFQEHLFFTNDQIVAPRDQLEASGLDLDQSIFQADSRMEFSLILVGKAFQENPTRNKAIQIPILDKSCIPSKRRSRYQRIV